MMGIFDEFSIVFVHWSLGMAVCSVMAASEFSGPSTLIALPIAAVSTTVSALCGSTINSSDTSYKKRKFTNILEFFQIWLEILELLSVSAICARIASATVDYISGQRLRELFLGIQSHSVHEPWPDVVGVSVIIVITALFMLGLERSTSFSILLITVLCVSFIFFITVGNLHTVITFDTWKNDFKTDPILSILTAATLCCYGFVNTLPKINQHRFVKILTIIIVPLFINSTTILVFTLMSHYKELTESSTPFLRIFEIRDVDWARLIMAICIITIVCLTLTEILPILYKLFVILATKEWQVFLTSLQYKSPLTGAPMLAIFAAGSLAAILAFACPLNYLLKIINTSMLMKCTIRAINLLYNQYKPHNESYLINSTNTQYQKLKQTSTEKRLPPPPKRILKLVPFIKGNNSGPSGIINKSKKFNQDDEYLLLDEYCDKTIDPDDNESSDDNDNIERESVLSTDSCSSTDIDAVVQEYKDKIQIATIDNFNDNRQPTCSTAIIVAIFLSILIISSILLSQMLIRSLFDLAWTFLSIGLFAIIVILLMPKNSIIIINDLVPISLLPVLSMLSIKFNIVLISTVIQDLWPGFLFWFCAGGLLLWRCDCCTCDGLFQKYKNRLTITENLNDYPDKFPTDTILITTTR